MQDRTQLLTERATGIGGSDIHQVFSLEPYGCARRLWLEKTAVPPDYDTDKPIFDRGNKLESIVIDMFAQRHQDIEVLRQPRFWRHSDEPHMICHTDAYMTGALIEAKTVGERMWHKIRRDGIPEAYILQMQHMMMVTGYERGWFAILWPDGWQFAEFEVQSAPAIQQQISEAADEFWRRVVTKSAPDRLEPTDRRCQTCAWRTTCQGQALIEGAGDDWRTGDDLQQGDDAALGPLLDRYWRLKELHDEATDLYEQCKDDIKRVLDSATAVEIPGSRIYYRPQTSMRIDSKLIRKKYPDVAQECEKPSISRPLRIYAR